MNIDETIASARLAFGHIEGRTDIECLCLRISQLDSLAKERLSALNNATQRARFFERILNLQGIKYDG